jgi:hypothetical protein
LVAEGIAGTVDKYHRGPVLSVGVVRDPGLVKILADAYVQDEQYTDYPIQFQFFVNRHLFSTQIRSKALPGAVGVEIGPNVAVPPFNYTVVAKLLHPNREFTTVIEGAVFGTTLNSTLDCTLTAPESSDESADSDIFTEDSVTLVQTGNNSGSITLTNAGNADGSAQASASASFTLSSDNSTAGTVAVTRGGKTTTVSATGTATVSSGALSQISLMSADSAYALECS